VRVIFHDGEYMFALAIINFYHTPFRQLVSMDRSRSIEIILQAKWEYRITILPRTRGSWALVFDVGCPLQARSACPKTGVVDSYGVLRCTRGLFAVIFANPCFRALY